MANTKWSAVPVTTTLLDTDLVCTLASAANETITFANFRTQLGTEARWQTIPTTDYTATPPASIYTGAATALSAWTTGHAYVVGDYVKPTAANGYIYECHQAGTSHATTEPTWSTTLGASTTDNTAKWTTRGCHLITMIGDYTAILLPGQPIRYTWGGTVYYAVVVAVGALYIAVAGAPMHTDANISALQYGRRELAVTMNINVAGSYGASIQNILDAVLNQARRWGGTKARLVSFGLKHKTAAGTTQPVVNARIAGNSVSRTAADNGIAVSTAWQDNSYVAINVSNYTAVRGDALELRCTVAGTGSAAADLSADLTFVLE